MYKPDNTQQSARYSIAPFRHEVISLKGVNRADGETFPQPEGQWLYVMGTDFPVQISFVNAATGSRQTVIASTGMFVDAPFKGLTLAHPLITTPGAGNANDNLSLHLLLGSGAGPQLFENDFAFPFAAMQSAWREDAGTQSGTERHIAIFVPTGARYLKTLQVEGIATTLTSADVALRAGIFPSQSQCQALQFTANGNVYNNVFGYGESMVTRVSTGVGAASPRGIAVAQDINIPTYCNELAVSFYGTGLAALGYVKAIFA